MQETFPRIETLSRITLTHTLSTTQGLLRHIKITGLWQALTLEGTIEVESARLKKRSRLMEAGCGADFFLALATFKAAMFPAFGKPRAPAAGGSGQSLAPPTRFSHKTL